MWLLIALLSALINSGRELLIKHRHAESHPLAAAWRSQVGLTFFCALGMLWLAGQGTLIQTVLRLQPYWTSILLGCFVESIAVFLYFYAMRHLPIGVFSIIYSSSPLWVLLIGLFWRDDGALTPISIAGITLLTLSVAVPVLGRTRGTTHWQGFIAAMAVAVVFAATGTIHKQLVLAAGPFAICFWLPWTLVYFTAALAMSPEGCADLRRRGLFTIHTCVAPLSMGVLAMTMVAYAMAPVASVMAVKRLAVLFTVAGSVWLLRERVDVRRNLAGAALAVAGAWLLL